MEKSNDLPTNRHNPRRSNGFVPIPFWTTALARRQLRMLAAEEDTTQQKLIAEALNMLFDRRGKPIV
jgi:hypothetical protein